MKKNIIILLLFLSALLLLVSCTKDPGVEPIVDPPVVKKSTISVTAGPNVTVNNTSFTVVNGESVTVTATVDKYYEIDAVLVDGVAVTIANNLNTYSYSFSNITANHSIKVTSKITPLGTSFNLLSMPKAFVQDSIHVRTLGTTHWGYNETSYHDSFFFRPDYKFEIFRDGKLIGEDTYFLTDNPLTINFKGSPHGPWRVLILDEKTLKIITYSINTTDGEDIQFVFTHH